VCRNGPCFFGKKGQRKTKKREGELGGLELAVEGERGRKEGKRRRRKDVVLLEPEKEWT